MLALKKQFYAGISDLGFEKDGMTAKKKAGGKAIVGINSFDGGIYYSIPGEKGCGSMYFYPQAIGDMLRRKELALSAEGNTLTLTAKGRKTHEPTAFEEIISKVDCRCAKTKRGEYRCFITFKDGILSGFTFSNDYVEYEAPADDIAEMHRRGYLRF